MTIDADAKSGPYRIGVDIGGTFTDFALFDDASGGVHTHKCLTTPLDPAEAVIDGIASVCRQACLEPRNIATIVHGTTLVTNAIIERKGVPTAMLVTRGFRDTLDIALERRYDLFDLRLRFPPPVVPRHLRFEVDGRVRADGSEEIPLALDETIRAALHRAIERHGIEAVAVCYLHSYLDDRHETATVDWLREHFPALAVSASSVIFPYMREYERWTTTCLNSYVQPVVDRYLAAIEAGLARLAFAGKFLIMSSSGGTLTSELARQFPVRLLESGPAAGALMSARHGRALGHPQVLSFDMGGTTAKGCIIQNGATLKRYELEVAREHEFKKGSGLPAKIPVVDMIEIGAGGGSLAEVDERGTLRVGPRSAGADPGPACYGRGGRRPTLTDANLLLGYLSPDWFLGGRMALDPNAARGTLIDHVAHPLGVDVERAAWGVHEVINEDVARAFRIHASERGVDFRRCTIVAFGGSGPLHGARVARKLKIGRVVCPWGAGVMSAFGLLASPIGFELVRSNRMALNGLLAASFAEQIQRLGDEASRFLDRAGVEQNEIRLHYKVDMRYEGQGHEIEVDLPASLPATAILGQLPNLFFAAYKSIFGIHFNDRRIEIVNWKVEAFGPLPHRADYQPRYARDGRAAMKGERPAYFPEVGGFVDCPVYDRYALSPGFAIQGPGLVEENESTCMIAPGDVCRMDARHNLVIEIGG